MRNFSFFALFTLAAAILLPATALPAVGGTNLPFRGSASGQTTLDLATGKAHALSSGPLTHFGEATVEQYIQLIPTGPASYDWLGNWTATAADGDAMSGTSIGSGILAADGIHSTWHVSYQSTAGTGRFHDADLAFEGIAYSTSTSVEGTIVNSVFDASVAGVFSH